MKTTSITRQSLSTVLIAELLCAFAFSCVAVLHEHQIRFRAFDIMLQGRSDSLLGAIQDAEDPEDNVAIDPTELNLPTGDIFAVYNQGGRLLGTSSNAPAQLIERGREGFTSRDFEGHGYRVLQRDGLRIIDREESGGVGLRRPVTIVYGARTNRIWREVFEAATYSVIVSFVLLCVTAALLFVQLRRILQPLETLAIAAEGVSTSSISFEPPTEALHLRELQPLASALSATMTRLREAFDSQHRFIGDATHELKTAVAVVRSTIQLLTLKPRSEADYREGLLRILDDNSRVEELVSRMLMLARLEERAADPVVTVNLAEVAGLVLAGLQSLAEIHGVLLESALHPDVPVRLASDRGRVLVSNLVVNAVQHSQRGSTVRLSVQRDATIRGRTAILTVQDTGTGISDDALPHVFKRFYREDISRSRETGGAGLGLAICHAIVEAAGGEIKLQSRPGEGTKVTVFFSLD